VPITVCDVGLGLENWWSYVTRDVGPQGKAFVNAANGNLVVQQTDSTPVQAHGRLGYVLRRTYNSEDTTLATLPGSFGAGWQLNIGQADDLASDGVTTAGLSVPSAEAVANPLAVTLIDRDGTRHVFSWKGATVGPIDVTNPLSGPRAAIVPNVLKLDATKYTHLCAEQTYSAPAGVHISLWRYIEVSSGSCGDLTSGANPPVVLGFAAERPDRVRYEFSWDGHLLDMVDGSGVDLRYRYDAPVPLALAPLGKLTTVYEPRSCADPTLPAGTACRAFRFNYSSAPVSGGPSCPAPPSGSAACIADPAGRVTKYFFDGDVVQSPLAVHLTSVANPDASTMNYTYHGIAGATCGSSAHQLCSASDPRGGATRFTYGPAPLGPARIATVTDRRNTATTFSYSANPD